jgi:16S rRNA processing protein RimM
LEILLGYIVRAFGIKGGVVIKLLNDDSSSLSVGLPLIIHQGKLAKTLTISSIMDRGRIMFQEISDRTEAESLKGAQIFTNRELLPALEEDEYYLADMLGASIVDTKGQVIGELIDYSSNNAQILLEIKTPDNKLASIPSVKPIVDKIDCVNKIIYVDLPEGLLDLD